MAGLSSIAPELVEFAALDRAWADFFRELEAHAHDPARWFTPARATALEDLLRRGQRWLESAPDPHPERVLYAMHLRRLLPALQRLQRELAATAARLQHAHQHLSSVRAWAGTARPVTQGAAHPAPRPHLAPAAGSRP
ncbi:MAG: hypothetical protein ACRD01_06005 [Terriglobales bacterium]